MLSHVLIIHEEKTKEIATVKEAGKRVLNYHKHFFKFNFHKI